MIKDKASDVVNGAVGAFDKVADKVSVKTFTAVHMAMEVAGTTSKIVAVAGVVSGSVTAMKVGIIGATVAGVGSFLNGLVLGRKMGAMVMDEAAAAVAENQQ